MDVEQERDDQAGSQDPQEHVLRDDGGEELAELAGVDVDVGNATDGREEHLEVAHHVRQGEADDQQPGDCHHPLLAYGRPVELDRERGALGLACGGGHGLALWQLGKVAAPTHLVSRISLLVSSGTRRVPLVRDQVAVEIRSTKYEVRNTKYALI